MRWLDLDIGDPGVKRLIADTEMQGIWEYLRRIGHTRDAQSLAKDLGLGISKIHSALDGLVELGAVEWRPGSGKRRQPTYVARFDCLRIRCDIQTDGIVLQTWRSAMSDYIQSRLPKDPLEAPTAKNYWRSYFVGVMHLAPDEIMEFRKRINTLVEFAEMLGQKCPPRGESPPLCNYAFQFRVDPLEQPALPLVNMRLIPRNPSASAPDLRFSGQRSRQKPLSNREYEVAIAMGRGLNRHEIAARLGISSNTVATLAKRAYRKLEVSRRAQLMTRLRERYGDQAASTGTN